MNNNLKIVYKAYLINNDYVPKTNMLIQIEIYQVRNYIASSLSSKSTYENLATVAFLKQILTYET